MKTIRKIVLKRNLFMGLLTVITTLTTGTVNADITSGLAAHYTFSGNANDGSGYGNDGTVNGATLTIDRFGNPDSAYAFDGASYIDMGNDTSINIAGSLTLSTWLKVDDLQAISSGQALVGKFGPSHGPVEDNQYMLQLGPGGTIGFNPYDDAGVQGVSYNLPNSLSGKWLHVVGTYGSNVGSLYLNGALVAQNNNIGATPYQSNINLTLGATPFDGPEDRLKRYFIGSLDDTRIYNSALTSNDISQLYNIEVVPVPGAVLLGMIGLGAVGIKLRKHA